MIGPSQLVLTGVVLFLGSVLHSAAGFAFALFAIPVLLFLGWAPYQAIALTAVCVIVHGCISVGRSNERPEWKSILGWVAIAVGMQPVGGWILGQIVSLERTRVAQVFGCILLAVLAVKLWLRPEPQERLHPRWGVLTMLVSGVISGLSGMGGPPIVLWLMAHKWPNERIRVTLWTMFAGLAVTNLCWLAWRFGRPVVEAGAVGLLFTPITFLGTLPGARIAAKMSPDTMRNAATVILVLVAVYAVSQPYVFPNLGRVR
jgi:uncharacterized membrane protein YfcA